MNRRAAIATLAASAVLPADCQAKEGALMSLGIDAADTGRRTVEMIVRILQRADVAIE